MSGSRSRPEGTSMIDKLADPVRDMPRSGIRDFFDIVSQMKEVISLSIGEPDFVTPWHIREHAIFALEQGRTGYTGNRGLPQLLKPPNSSSPPSPPGPRRWFSTSPTIPPAAAWTPTPPAPSPRSPSPTT